MLSNYGWKAQPGAQHHQASPCMMCCAIVTISSILRCENIIASQRKSARQGAGRGMGIPAAISPAVLHRTLPCPGTWTSQLLCRPCASDFHATRSAHSRVGREGTALHFGTIAVTLGGQASARPASPILSQEWTEIPGTSPSSWDRILEPSTFGLLAPPLYSSYPPRPRT